MKFDEIDDALDIVKDTSETIEIDNVKPIKCDKDDLDRDYEYTRGHLYSLIEKGQERILTVSWRFLKRVDLLRQHEVTGQIIKSVVLMPQINY